MEGSSERQRNGEGRAMAAAADVLVLVRSLC